MLLRPEVPAAQLPTLSLVVSLAVRRALVALADPEAGANILIKWPNDLVVSAAGKPLEEAAAAGAFAGAPYQPAGVQPAGGAEHRKICGISLEAHAGGVCVGVGVNVCAPSERPDVGGKNEPAYLAEIGSSPSGASVRAGRDGLGTAHIDLLDRVAATVLDRFAPLYERWCTEGFAPLVAEYNAHASLNGRFVRMEDMAGGLVAEGRVAAVDDKGHLILTAEDGTVCRVASGEAHLV